MIDFSKLFDPVRIDAETYRPFYLEIETKVTRLSHERLGDIVSRIKKGIFDIKSENYSNTGIPFVRISNLKRMGISTNDIIYIPEAENKKNLDTFLVKGDIILSKTAYPAASLVHIENCNTSQDTVAIKLKKNSGFKSSYVVTFLNTKFGFYQMQRWFTGNIQMHLNLTDCKGIFIPKLSTSFQEQIDEIVWKGFQRRTDYEKTYKEAEIILLGELDLRNFDRIGGKVNIKSFNQSYGVSNRLDAEYYQPKFDKLEELIREKAIYYKQIREIRSENFRGLQPEYTEGGSLNIINSKHILETTLEYDNFEKTDLMNWENQRKARVFKNDILTYTTGAYVGRTQVYLIDDKALASNHVNILRLNQENPQYVAFVMNSMIGRLQTEKYSAGSAQAELYPKDIDEFIIPFVSKAKQERIVNMINQSYDLKNQSEKLLSTAKAAVEIAIEQNESSGIQFIKDSYGR